jgi:hypothetical protein
MAQPLSGVITKRHDALRAAELLLIGGGISGGKPSAVLDLEAFGLGIHYSVKSNSRAPTV